MPSESEVRTQLTDILVAVVDADPADVVDDARLKDLGVDSLAAVEVADELGRRFGIHIADRTVDEVVTVRDALRAVAGHPDAVLTSGEASGPSGTVAAVGAPASSRSTSSNSTGSARVRADAAWRFATWFVVAGLVIGGGLGFLGALTVRATGLGSVDLPPIAMETTATPSPTPTASPTPTPTPTTDEPQPTFSVESAQVSPGQRFGISGRFPDLGVNEELQVQVKDPGQEWDDFPVTVATSEGGRFETEIYTSRTGEREFRVVHIDSGDASPSASVTIG